MAISSFLKEKLASSKAAFGRIANSVKALSYNEDLQNFFTDKTVRLRTPQESMRGAENIAFGSARRSVDFSQNVLNTATNFGSKVTGIKSPTVDFSRFKEKQFGDKNLTFGREDYAQNVGAAGFDLAMMAAIANPISSSTPVSALQNYLGRKAGTVIAKGAPFVGKRLANVSQGLPYTLSSLVTNIAQGKYNSKDVAFDVVFDSLIPVSAKNVARGTKESLEGELDTILKKYDIDAFDKYVDKLRTKGFEISESAVKEIRNSLEVAGKESGQINFAALFGAESIPSSIKPDDLSSFAKNSLFNLPDTAKEGIVNKYSLEEAKTGLANNGKYLKNRIVIDINDAGEAVLADGRHLLEGYRQSGIDIPLDKVEFRSEAAREAFEKMTKGAESISELVSPKLEVGGGKYSTARFNLPERLDRELRKAASEMEDRIKYSRRGEVSWEETLKDSETVTIANILDRKRGEAVNDATVAAGSRNIKALMLDIEDIKNRLLASADDPVATEELQKELLLKMSLRNAVQEQVLGGITESARALNAAKILANSIQNPQEKLASLVSKNKDVFGNSQKILDDLQRFDPQDREGMLTYLMEATPSTPIDKLESVFINNVLSGTTTQLTNVIGNFARLMYQLSLKPVSVGIDVVESAVTGKPRTEWLSTWGPEALGAVQGMRTGFKKALFAFNTGLRTTNLEQMKVAPQALKGKFGKIYNIPTRSLLAADEFFRSMNNQMLLNKFAWEDGLSKGLEGDELVEHVAKNLATPPADMMEKADKLATDLLYQTRGDETEIGKALKDKLSIDMGKLGKFKPMSFIIPFITTPINVAKFGLIETTPIGLASSTGKRVLGKITRNEFNREFASALVGTAQLAILASYFDQGEIIGEFPVSAKERDALYAQGKLPNSIKIGNKWVPFDKMPEPLASHLTILAGLRNVEKVKDEEGFKKAYGELLVNVLKSYKDRTYLANLSQLLDAIDDPERYGGRFMNNIIVSSTPVVGASILAAEARASDRTVREQPDLLSAYKARIPGLSQTLPAKESEFQPGGEATRNYSPSGEFVPFRFSPAVPNYRADLYLSNLDIKRKKAKDKKKLQEQMKNMKYVPLR